MRRVLTIVAIVAACSRPDERRAAQSNVDSATTQVSANNAAASDKAAFVTDSAGDTIRIARVEAHLIYDDGTVSEDIIGAHPWTLWNTIIGEGDAKKPSHATGVHVVLTGPAGRGLSGGQVELLVDGLRHEGDTTAFDAALDKFDSTGTQTVAFTLKDTGCGLLVLLAKVTVQAAVARRGARIEFDCGE